MIPMTNDEVEEVEAMLAEGFHTAFRKGLDSPRAQPIWKAINDLPDTEWVQVIRFVMFGLRPHIEGHLLPSVVKRVMKTKYGATPGTSSRSRGTSHPRSKSPDR